jgi:tRNA A-37 threonylcarbamoyl transferase component Bud32
MEMPGTNGSPHCLTGPYHPSDGADSRPAVGVVAGSAPVSENELAPLLHKRLRFLVLVFLGFYGVTAIVMRALFAHTRDMVIDNWANAATLVILVGLLAILSGRRQLALRQLRVVEFVLFGVFAARLVARGYSQFWVIDHFDRVHTWIAAGEVLNARESLSGLAHRFIATSAMFVVAYGVIVPNTWRRCAVVVAAFTAQPAAIWVVACVDRGLPADYWFTFGSAMAWWSLILIAVMSIYGAYRIETSRQEAAEARRLGQYVLREKIGGGGMGEVYLADHVLLRRPCAVKLIRPEKAGDPAMLQRFEREVRVTATLTHPNTVQVFDYGHTPDGTFYYVMEYLPGHTLDEIVRRHGPLPPGRAVHFLRQVCAALGEAHARGLTHRDIKPGNVMVCERGGVCDVAKVLDFGLVRIPKSDGDGGTLTREGTVAGTPAYMSPEQAGGEAVVDPRSDIYSVGALAYFLLTGKPPFADRSAARMLAAHLYEPPGALPAAVPTDLAAVVLRCLAKAPSERWPDAASLEAALAGTLVAAWSARDAAAWWEPVAGGTHESQDAVATATSVEPGAAADGAA